MSTTNHSGKGEIEYLHREQRLYSTKLCEPSLVNFVSVWDLQIITSIRRELCQVPFWSCLISDFKGLRYLR